MEGMGISPGINLAASDPISTTEPVASTPFARKYGVATTDFDPLNLFRPRGKSGFTPTEPLNTILPPAAEKPHETIWIDDYQARIFGGFSTRMLDDLGALADPEATLTSLTNPMHPIFIRKWESTIRKYRDRPDLPLDLKGDCYSIPDTSNGVWAMDNPVVREVMEPSLRLASRFLENIHTSQWLDAFLSGPFRPLDPALDPRLPNKKASSSLYTFHRPPFNLVSTAAIAAKAKSWLLDTLTPKILFAIADARFDPLDRTTPHEPFYYACTGGLLSEEKGKEHEVANVLVTLSTQLITPLLRNDLSVGERLMEQAFVALVILHELGHAVNLSLVNSPSHPQLSSAHEPFFESEPVAELGHSFVSSFLGSTFQTLFHRNPDIDFPVPRMAFAMTDWPNVSYPQGMTLLGDKGLRDTSTAKPVLAKWYEVIQTDEFWDTGVERLGLGLAKPWTGTGMKTSFGAGTTPPTVSGTEEVEPTPEEIEGELKRYGDRMWAVMQFDPEHKKAFVYAESVEKMRKNALEQRFFRRKREMGVRELGIAVANVRAAKGWVGEVDGLLAALLEKLQAEAQEQLTELLTFIRQKGLQDPDLAQHKDFLIRLNRHLRKLTSDFKDECNTDSLAKLEIESRPMQALLTGCQTILSDPDPPIPDPTQYLENQVTQADTAMATALTQLETAKMNQVLSAIKTIYTPMPTNAQLETDKMTQVLSAIKINHTPTDIAASRTELRSLLLRARKAHLDGDAQLCHDYVTDILLNLDDSQMTDNMSKLAEVVARAFLCRKMEVDDRLAEAERLVVALKGIGEGLERGEEKEKWMRGEWAYWVRVAGGMVSVQLRRSRVGRVSVREHIERVWGPSDDMDLI